MNNLINSKIFYDLQEIKPNIISDRTIEPNSTSFNFELSPKRTTQWISK